MIHLKSGQKMVLGPKQTVASRATQPANTPQSIQFFEGDIAKDLFEHPAIKKWAADGKIEVMQLS